jgi:hypothetical protein
LRVGAADWSSLEIVKLVIAAATPIVVVLLGVAVTRAARHVEQAQWTNRKLIERRLELYDEMAGLLNDLYCFFQLVGNFREIEPPTAVAHKRRLDKAFHVNEFLMGPEFGRRYRAFMDTCFLTYTGFGEDAKLRSQVGWQYSEREPAWQDAWKRCFVTAPADVAPLQEVEEHYRALMECFAELIGVEPPNDP